MPSPEPVSGGAPATPGAAEHAWAERAAVVGAGAATAGAILLGASPVPGLLLAAGVAGAALLVAARPRVPAEVAGLALVLGASLTAIGSNDSSVRLWQIAFGVLLVGYVVAWFGTAVVGGRRFVRDGADVALIVYLLLSATLWAGLGLAGTGWGEDVRADLSLLPVVALFFPAREVCIRASRGPHLLTAALLTMGLVATGRSAWLLYGVVTGATELYEVVDVRASSGEIQILGALPLALLLGASVRRRGGWLLALSAALLGGLILSKSRGPWAAAVLALAAAMALLPADRRARVAGTTALAVASLVAAAWLVLGPRLALIGAGLVRRLASFSTAATQDVSIINRYAEASATWQSILEGPVLGHGWGAPVIRYDWIAKGTYTWTFVHNGYLWLWHHTGAAGLLLMVGVLVAALVRGVGVARDERERPTHRVMAAAATGSLVAFLILVLPSNPFAVLDQMLVLTLTLALLSGLSHRRTATR